MTQEQYDRIIGIFATEKMRIDAISQRGEKIRRFIATVRIAAALDWAEIEHELLSEKND